MKRNKLVIAMGFAGAVLVGCNGSDSATDTNTTKITAIDGYIVNGLVTMTCDGNTFDGSTNKIGVASIDTSSHSAENCTALIKGGPTTYDYDKGEGTGWNHTMMSLPGLAVINPFTDLAALLVENDPTLTGTLLLEEVYKTLGLNANLVVGGANLFVDFGTNNPNRGDALAKMSLVAQSAFATIAKAKVDQPDISGAEQVNLLKAALPIATDFVATTISKNPNVDLTKVVFTPVIPDLSGIKFGADGKVTSDLSKLVFAITIETIEPGYVPATGTGTGTGTEGVNQG
jgi:hypothetical protein